MDSNNLDDGQLKEALSRAFGREPAPAELRVRIEQMISRGDCARRRRMFIGGWAWGAMAAAAMVAVALGGIAVSAKRTDPLGRPVLAAMVKAHEGCCCKGDHCEGCGDLRKVGREIGQKLHEAVLCANLADDGWEFRGGSACRVNGAACAHLIFARRAARISIFSMPPGRVADADVRAEEVDGYLVAAMAHGGQVYGMVGKCPRGNLKLEELRALLVNHQNEIVGGVAVAPHGWVTKSE